MTPSGAATAVASGLRGPARTAPATTPPGARRPYARVAGVLAAGGSTRRQQRADRLVEAAAGFAAAAATYDMAVPVVRLPSRGAA